MCTFEFSSFENVSFSLPPLVPEFLSVCSALCKIKVNLLWKFIDHGVLEQQVQIKHSCRVKSCSDVIMAE